MILKRLVIRRVETWETPNSGKFEARMEWEDKEQSVSLCLEPEVSEALLKFCAPLLTKFAAESARKLEAAALAAIPEKPALSMESES